MLTVSGLQGGYGQTPVLFDVSLRAPAKARSSRCSAATAWERRQRSCSIMGILPPTGGEVSFRGRPIHRQASYRIAQCGIGLVPEGRQVFPTLTVRENLIATAANRTGHTTPWCVDAILELFPALLPRIGTRAILLSGGEQQMLAIGRALMTNPHLMILDEATEGLAPVVRRDIWQVLAKLKSLGHSILVIDKNVSDLIELATKHYVVEKGRTVWSGTSRDLRDNRDVHEKYLSV